MHSARSRQAGWQETRHDDGGNSDYATTRIRGLIVTSQGGILASCNAAAADGCQHYRMPLRCLIVDDSDAFLETANALLEREGVTVVGVASSTAEALQQA